MEETAITGVPEDRDDDLLRGKILYIVLGAVIGALFVAIAILLGIHLQRAKTRRQRRSQRESLRAAVAEAVAADSAVDPTNVVVLSFTLNNVEINEAQQARLETLLRPTGRNETVGVPLLNTVRPIDAVPPEPQEPQPPPAGSEGGAGPVADNASGPLVQAQAHMSAVVVDRNGNRIPCALPRMSTGDMELHLLERKASCDVYERFFAAEYNPRAPSDAIVTYMSPTAHLGHSFTIAFAAPQNASMVSLAGASVRSTYPSSPTPLAVAQDRCADPVACGTSRSGPVERKMIFGDTSHEPCEYETPTGGGMNNSEASKAPDDGDDEFSLGDRASDTTARPGSTSRD